MLRLEGYAVDERGAPVAGARIVLDFEREATSAADGAFAFDDVAPGTVRLAARAGALSTELALATAYPGREPVRLTLERSGELTVTVTAEGALLAGARVCVAESRPPEVLAVTGADGCATVHGVGAGFQLYEVVADGWAPAFVWLGSETSRGERQVRAVALARGAALGGVVRGPGGEPVAGAVVRFVKRRDWGGAVVADERGAWRVPCAPPGAYEIHARGAGWAPGPHVAVAHDGVAPRTELELRVAAGGRIEGRVVDEAGAPVPHAAIEVSSVGVEPEWHEQRTARADARGDFAVGGLAPGAHAVAARDLERAAADATVTVVDGEVARVDLVAHPGSIAGIVVDEQGAPLAGVEVRAMCTRGDITDRAGRFHLGAFPPGEHLVAAEWPNQRRRMDASRAKVAAGDTAVRLALPALATITGRVVVGGAPLVRYAVQLTTAPLFPWIGHAIEVRKADGRFTLGSVAPGRWAIVVAGLASSC